MARKAPGFALLLLLIAAAGLGQNNNTAPLEEAKSALGVAESAGAPTYAKGYAGILVHHVSGRMP